MKKFIIYILLFCAPIFTLLLFPPSYFLYKNKECFYDIDKLIDYPSNYLLGLTYKEQNYPYFKWKLIQTQNRKEIWSLGNSRALQFRKEMFEKTFYNAGYTVFSVNDLKPFFQGINKNKYPQYLILNLDFNWFNINSDALTYFKEPNFWKKSKSKYPTFVELKSVWIDHIIPYQSFKKHEFVHADEVHLVGINANINNSGLRNDGSMYYGKQIERLSKSNSITSDFFDDTFERIKKGNRGFEHGKDFNEIAIATLNDFLLFCKSNDITVIGFFLPYPKKVCEQMEQSNHYNFIKPLTIELTNTFCKNGLEFYDYTAIEFSDNDFLDGFHPSEVICQKILLDILEKDTTILNTICDKNKMQRDLNCKINRYLIYE